MLLQKALYKNPEWLFRERILKRRIYDDIAKECNVESASIFYYHHKFMTKGLYMKYNKYREWTKEEDKELIKWRKQHYKNYEIATKMYRTLDSIESRVTDLGIGNQKFNKKTRHCSEETKKKMSNLFLGRKIINGHWTKSSEEEKDIIKEKGENKVISNKTSRYFEELKKHKNIDEDLINKASVIAEKVDREKQIAYNNYLKDMKDRDDQLLRDLQLMLVKATEKAHEPVRKTWYLHIKDKEENTNIIIDKFYDWTAQMRIGFPKSQITLSSCKDYLTETEKEQFK